MRFTPRTHDAIEPEMIREVYLYTAHVEVGYSPILRATWRRIVLDFVMLQFYSQTVRDTGIRNFK